MSEAHTHSHSVRRELASWAAAVAAGLAIGLIVGSFVEARQVSADQAPGDGARDAAALIETFTDGTSIVTRSEREDVPETIRAEEAAGPREAGPENGQAIGIAGSGEIEADGVGGIREGAGGADRGHAGAGGGHAAPSIPVWLCVPFVALLLSIALMPFALPRFWHRHYPEVSLALGSFVSGVYLSAFGGAELHGYGVHALTHAGLEYYSFIALIGGLFVVSGGILIEINTRGRPVANTILLAVGAVLANVVGTTGASMLLIRPFMRMNAGRLRPVHIVFFIFIVSNCGGCLTPIGDPPLYLGFLKGVPFVWTLTHLWKEWALVVGLLLVLFFVTDTVISRRDARAPGTTPSPPTPPTPGAASHAAPNGNAESTGIASANEMRVRRGVRVRGASGLVCLALMIAGVFIDPALTAVGVLKGVPVGATFQLLVAGLSLRLAPRPILDANGFNFHPVREVALLFAGIFATMVPALGYLAEHAPELGLESATQYYFATGGLSAVLDNAPTYLNFLQTACSVLGVELSPAGIRSMLDASFTIDHAAGEDVRVTGVQMLSAISTGAVFFGACTYIGNGPNFMVKAIAESPGELRVRMPSFFGYVGLALAYLVPVLVLNWLVFIR